MWREAHSIYGQNVFRSTEALVMIHMQRRRGEERGGEEIQP